MRVFKIRIYTLRNKGTNRVPWAPLGYIVWYLGYFIRPRVLLAEKGTSRPQRVLQDSKGYFRTEKARHLAATIFRTIPTYFEHFHYLEN